MKRKIYQVYTSRVRQFFLFDVFWGDDELYRRLNIPAAFNSTPSICDLKVNKVGRWI